MTYSVFSGMLNPTQSVNPDAGVYPSRQLCEVTAIWQIAYCQVQVHEKSNTQLLIFYVLYYNKI